MRKNFSKKTKLLAFERSGGKCENCGARLFVGNTAFDHDIPDALGGTDTAENCSVLCRACHGQKTATQDMPRIAKTRRVRVRQAGIVKPRTITAWRRFDGTIVRASRER